MKEWKNLVQLGDAFSGTPPEVSDRCYTLAVINMKGGVGKTTTAVNVAAGLSVRGRVLLIDLDAQRSATVFLGAQKMERYFTAAEVLLGQISMARAIRTTDIPDLHLLQGGMKLSNVEAQLAERTSRTFVLQDRIETIRKRYDFIVIDCAPSMSLLSVNALVAADGFIVPVIPQFLAVKAMEELLTMVRESRSRMVPFAPLLGIVLTMVDGNSNEKRRVIERLRLLYGKKIFDTEIDYIAALAESPAAGQTIFEYATHSGGSNDYWQFTKEVMRRCLTLDEPDTQKPPDKDTLSERLKRWGLFGRSKKG